MSEKTTSSIMGKRIPAFFGVDDILSGQTLIQGTYLSILPAMIAGRSERGALDGSGQA